MSNASIETATAARLTLLVSDALGNRLRYTQHVGGPLVVSDRITFARIVIRDRPTVVCEKCLVADTPRSRLKGLLGRSDLPPGEGLLLRPAFAIHTWFMRFPIDVVFLDRDLGVIAVAADLGPWRGAARRGARAVLELASGECNRRGLRLGDRLGLLDRTF
jgi:uncharacterized membrane protein (UPF0127 family)